MSQLLPAFTQHPGMYIQEPKRYWSVAAFVRGYSLGTEELTGFREWLVPQVGYSNFGWEMLVLQLAFPDAAAPHDEAEARPSVAIQTLFRLLAEFEALRATTSSLREIFVTYQRWLEKQRWYDKDAHEWIAPRLTKARKVSRARATKKRTRPR